MSFFSASPSSGNQVDGSPLAFVRRLCELAGILGGVQLSVKMSMFLQNLSALLQSYLPKFWKTLNFIILSVDLVEHILQFIRSN